MSINTDFYLPTAIVTWNAQEACTVRGITPDDIARLLTEDGEVIANVIEFFESEMRADVLRAGPEVAAATNAAADFMENNMQRLFGSILRMAPGLVAKIIALAADDLGNADAVRKWPMPLQFEAMRQIAVLTFVDTNGFREFVGNVGALVASIGQGQRRMTAHQVPSSESLSDTAG